VLYSCNKKFRVAASDFWDSVLSLNEADKLSVDIGHFPSYSVLKSAILNYGYIFDNCTEVSTSESVIAGWFHPNCSSFIYSLLNF
jgi:hypothetical protein